MGMDRPRGLHPDLFPLFGVIQEWDENPICHYRGPYSEGIYEVYAIPVKNAWLASLKKRRNIMDFMGFTNHGMVMGGIILPAFPVILTRLSCRDGSRARG